MSDDIEQLRRDRQAIEQALKALVAFVDPQEPAMPVLSLTSAQRVECASLLKECYRCLWSEHPGGPANV